MTKKQSTILERLVNDTFLMQELYEAKKVPLYAPMAEMILASENIASQAQDEWEFKSLARIGKEEFILHGDFQGRIRWLDEAQEQFAHFVSRFARLENLGLLLFVLDESGKYRVARLGDPAYDFVCRLNADDAFIDMQFIKPPSWAEELFLARENFEAMELIQFNNFGLESPKFKASNKLRVDAVIRETQRRMGTIPGFPLAADLTDTPLEKPLVTTERNTLLTIIAALCDYSAVNYQGRGAAGDIAKMTEELGAPVTDDTIRKVLAKIPNALETRMK